MSPYGEFLGIQIGEYGEGFARCSLRLQPHHMNAGGRVHGGVLTSLADTAAGVAVRSVRPDGKLSATTDLSIAFIRPPFGESLSLAQRLFTQGGNYFVPRSPFTVKIN